MTFKIITLGCKVNIYESEVIKEKLLNNNYQEVEDNANIVIINTCSVTNMADVKSRKIIRSAKRDNPNSIIVVCGCSAENHQEELNNLDIDILIGNKDKSKIVELLNSYLKNKQKITKFYDNQTLEFEDMQVDKFTSHTRGFIKIQDGCNNYCSYCIIPFMRGNIRSKDINIALEEAKTLVKNGHQEIVLTGIHTGSYGRGKDYDLVDLIDKMSKIENLKRIRISSIEITELNDKFLELLKNNPKVCNHLHIPLQAGSNKILKLMNRKYDTNYFGEMLKKIRTIRPNISITTDIIVGFPHETEEDFLETYEFAKKVEFAKIHVFPYSKRNGTVAAKMNEQVDGKVKKERAHRLLELSNTLEEKYNQKFLNQSVEVLIEENIDNTSIGHTSNYLKVIINKKIKKNTIINAQIIKIEKASVFAIN